MSITSPEQAPMVDFQKFQLVNNFINNPYATVYNSRLCDV